MELRRLTTADAEAYRAIRLAALKNAPQAFVSTYDEGLGKSLVYYKQMLNLTFTFGICKDTEILAIGSLNFNTYSRWRHIAVITAMYVTPDFQQQGLGRTILNQLIEQAKAFSEIEQIYLSVVANNKAAIALYEAAGFSLLSTKPRALKFADNSYADEHELVLYI